MVTAKKSFIEHAGYVLFPRNPNDLTSTTQCPACFTEQAGDVCTVCALDLKHPAIAELTAASKKAAASLDVRLDIIGRIRFETGQATAPAAVPAPPAAAASLPTAVVAPPTPTIPAPDAAPPRHFGVQVILLIVGVSLLSIGAIFFLVYAFITFGLFWRSIIIGSVTIAALVGASLLRRRNLRATAEAIGVLAIVFVALDAFALRANDLLDLGSSDPWKYWGWALVVIAVGFGVWHRVSTLRVASVAALVALPLGLTVLFVGLSEAMDDDWRTFLSFAVLAVTTLVHVVIGSPAARGAGLLERVLLLVLGVVGLVGLGIVSLFLNDSDWSPALGLVVTAVIALVHVTVIARVGAHPAFGWIFAALGGIAAASAVYATAVQVDSEPFGILAPPIAAAVVALLLEFVARRTTTARSYLQVAAGAAGAVAALTLLVPLGSSLLKALAVPTAVGVWVVPGGSVIEVTERDALSVLVLGIVVVLVAAAWAIGETLRSRLAAVLWAAGSVLVLAVPLLEALWLEVLGWLLLAAAAVGLLALARRRSWVVIVRMPLAVLGGIALALAYSSSWTSIDTWWYGSVAAVGLLFAARSAVATAAARAVLLAIATIVAFVAAAAEGWHINERFANAQLPAIEAAHTVAILAVVVLALSTLLPGLGSADRRILFWVPFVTAAIAGVTSWRYFDIAVEPGALVLPSALMGTVLGFALALVFALRTVRGAPDFAAERLVASAAIAPALAWAVDSLIGLAGGSDFARVLGMAVVLSVLHVLALTLTRAPLSAALAWTAIGFAVLIGFDGVIRDILPRIEWATVPVALALLASGAVALRRSPTAGSWPWLAPGLLMLLFPSLVATFVDQPVWRLVAIGVVAIGAILVGAFGKLQAPLVIGSVIVLIHAIRTFAPQIVAVYQLAEWWVWAVIGGAIVLFVALTFEKRVRDLRAVGGKVSALR